MPELPEVEALARFLTGRATGLRIERAKPLSFSAVKTVRPPFEALEGRRIAGASRAGKFLVLSMDPDAGGPLHLVVHFALAGWLRWSEALPTAPVKPGGAINARIRLEDGSGLDLTEAGTKHSLALYVVGDPAEVPGIAALGPDALVLDRAGFAAILEGSRQGIKNLLRDQTAIAGIGNAYSDEILHVARLSPFKPAGRIAAADVSRLFDAMCSMLLTAIEEAAGRPPAELKDAKRSGMRVHGRDGQPCPVCGDTIRSVKFSDRTFQYCPTCQTDGKPLADRVLSRLVK